MKRKYLFPLIGSVLLAALCVSAAAAVRSSSKAAFYQDTLDTTFHTNFSLFCSGLNDAALRQDPTGAETQYIYLCASTFSLTSYSENQDLGQIVRTLCDLSEQGALWERIDPQLAADLNRLSVSLTDAEVIQAVCDSLFA